MEYIVELGSSKEERLESGSVIDHIVNRVQLLADNKGVSIYRLGMDGGPCLCIESSSSVDFELLDLVLNTNFILSVVVEELKKFKYDSDVTVSVVVQNRFSGVSHRAALVEGHTFD